MTAGGGDFRLRNFIRHGVHSNPVQPCGEGRIAAKRVEGAKHLNESLLHQIFCFSHISRHPQTDRIHTLIMQLVECGKGLLVAALCALNESVFGTFSLVFSHERTHAYREYYSLVSRKSPLPSPSAISDV